MFVLYRSVRAGSTASTFPPAAFQYNPRQSIVQSEHHNPNKGHHAGAVEVVAPHHGNVVKMGKREAWTRFLAYEVSTHSAPPVVSPVVRQVCKLHAEIRLMCAWQVIVC